MNLAEELSGLAELRDRGVLTPREFDRRKRKLLRGKRPWWMTVLLWIIGIWCVVCLLAILIAIFVPAIRDHFLANDLACNTPEVQEKVVQLLNQQASQVFNLLGAGAAAPGMQIHGLDQVTELFKDQESGFLACLARTKHARGEGATGYTVAWTDRAKGEFLVQTASPEILMARYGEKTQQVQQASVAEEPATPEPAPHEDIAAVAEQMPAEQEPIPEPSAEPATIEVTQQEPSQPEEVEDARSEVEETAPKPPIPVVPGRRAAFVQTEQYGEISLFDSNAQRCGAGNRNAVSSGTPTAPPSRGCWSEGDGVVRITFSGPANGTIRLREEAFTRDPTYKEGWE